MAVKAKFWFYVSTSASVTAALYSSVTADDNWGATVEASEADWLSTNDNYHGSVSISTTGWKSIDVDTSVLDLSGDNWFHMRHTGEGTTDTAFGVFRTANYTGTDYDPYLEIWEESDSTPQRTLTGCGT